MQKRLMILGAGPGQVPAIRKAVEAGFYVITVDYLPDNMGHEFSHQFVNCSTTDKEGVLRIARELHVDGIVTFASDVATPAVAFVAEQLGLHGCHTSTAETMSNKARFRVFQREHGLNRPNFVVAQSLQEIEEQISTLSLPVMFKPVDTSGSRGITRVDELGHDLWVTAFEYAQSYSRSKKVCVEELVEGTDVSGDAFLANGRLEFVVITHKYKNGFVPAGHSLPTNISAEDQERVCAEITINCNAIGYNDGPLDFDVRVSPERVTVLEMSPRLGGNGIPMIIARATGVDLIAATLRFALGENVAFPSKCEIFRNCGSWIFGSNHAGRLKAIASAEELRAAVPEVFEYFVNYRVGDEVPQFVHSGNSLGYVLFDCPAHSTYQELINRLKIGLRLEVV